MAVSKRRITQKCRKTVEEEDLSEPEEAIRFDPNKKILRAKRRNERPNGPRVSLLGNNNKISPIFTEDQKKKGLNQSFIESVSKAYKIDNRYNFADLFTQYSAYRGEIEQRSEQKEQKPELIKGPIDLSTILRSGLSGAQPSPQQQTTQFILSQHPPMTASSTLFAPHTPSEKRTEETAKNEKAHSAQNENKKEAEEKSKNKIAADKGDDKPQEKKEKEKEVNEDIKDSKKKEAKDIKKEESKDIKKDTVKAEASVKQTHPKEQEDKEEIKPATLKKEMKEDKKETKEDKSASESDVLFDLNCKIFLRKTSKFDDIGFHRVVVHKKNSEKYITIYNRNTEIISVSVNKSSIRSEPGTKELAFVDPSTTSLYKIKLATVKDSNSLRAACNKKTAKNK
ncbi:hypothetical protein NEMIN01_0396 [Nematocida minor]|uniref:uncharacterized protein n=1 Tax=Nematocida minor TaxID=1912983 RepID=UPI00221E9C14|nr:uncharacterized protein NEMIN01_0396 [Nematocida minor]KAI5189230.1 hypothetical protein NEMIN01_0396 [Nematocida minor]